MKWWTTVLFIFPSIGWTNSPVEEMDIWQKFRSLERSLNILEEKIDKILESQEYFIEESSRYMYFNEFEPLEE